jgi:dTDP-4-amino-4,6-dideoxygalactose transaminase
MKLAINGGAKAVPDGTVKNWPPIDDIDRKMVLDSLNGNMHSFGPNCQAFEQEFASWNGNKFAITTNSGTAALHMGIVACGCSAGDEVIVTAYSWSSSATCILHHNCVPVFVDIDYDSINMDVNKIEVAITPKTKAIIVVHLHGLAVQMDPILELANKYKLKVIEDACQAHGALYKGRKVGTMGNCAAFSFNQNKSLCSGEGGMFVTDDEEMLDSARQLWSFGETRTPAESRDYHAYALGWMYRNNDLTAAFGRAQLTKLAQYLEIQRENAACLTETLVGAPGIILPFESPGCSHSYYNYTIRFDVRALGFKGPMEAARDRILEALVAEGVDTSIWQSFPLPSMTVFQAKNGYGHGCPWQCPYASPVDYSLVQYPESFRHCDTHTGMTTPLRAPNTPETARITGLAIRKVLENVDQLMKEQQI